MNAIIKLKLDKPEELKLDNINFIKIFDDNKITDKNSKGVTQISELDSEYYFYIADNCRYMFVCYNEDKQKDDDKTFINGSDILSVTFSH